MINYIKKHQVLFFFIFTSILGYGPAIITNKPIWFIYGMPISGLLIIYFTNGWDGVIKQLKDSILVRVKFIEYIKILALLLVINILTITIVYIIFGDIPSLKMIKTKPLLIPVLFLFILLGGPIFEEIFGLRGYALPELLKRKSPLISSIIVGAYFGAWHFIEFIRPGSTQYAIGIKYYPLFIISEIAVSIIMTSFYIRTKNIFISGVFFHWMMNNFVILFQTDITLSDIGFASKINARYFIIYTILLCIISIFLVFRSKFYINPLHLTNVST